MSQTYLREEHDGKYLHRLFGDFDEHKVNQIVREMNSISHKNILQYEFVNHIPAKKNMIGKVYENGEIQFLSEKYETTLMEKLNEMNRTGHILDQKMIESIIIQVGEGINSLRSFQKYFIPSLAPFHVVLTRDNDNQKLVAKVANYIPYFFKNIFDRNSIQYFHPEQWKLIEKNQDIAYEHNMEYTYAYFISMLMANQLPQMRVEKRGFFWNTTYRYHFTVSNNIPNMVKILVEKLLSFTSTWPNIYGTNPHLRQLRMAELNDNECRPEDFKFEKILGEGGEGAVFKVKRTLQNGCDMTVALKERTCPDEEYQKMIDNEVDIMRIIDHRNVVHIYDYFFTERSIFPDICRIPNERKAYIVMDFCDLGSLDHYFKTNFPQSPLPMDKMEKIIVDILNVVFFIHTEYDIIHRDLKAENILLKEDPSDPENFIVKLGDFGSS